MKQTELNALAHEIAMSTVQSDIECFCTSQQISGTRFGRWYDATTAAPDAKDYVDRAVHYLDALNLLEHHPENPTLVRMKKESR